MNEFLGEWGYLAVYVATTLEGEFAYLSAVVAATLGHLKLPGVMIAAFLGGYTRDMTIFLFSRYSGKSYFKRNPKSKEKIEKASNWVSSKPLFLTVHRFAYGISTATVIALGLSSMSVLRFGLVCAIACASWTLGYAALGYYAADQVTANLTWLQDNFLYVLIVVGVVGTAIYKLKK